MGRPDRKGLHVMKSNLLVLLVLLMFSQAASAKEKEPRGYLYDHATQVAIMYITAHYAAIIATYNILPQPKEVCRWEDDGVEHCYESVRE